MIRVALSQQVRQATARLHERIEAVLPLMQAGLTLGAYLEHLQALYPVVCTMEQALLPYRHELTTLMGDAGALADRSHLLRQDLAALPGFLPPVAHGPQAAFACSSLPFAVGCCYVVAGSKLGGQVIARNLARTLGLNAAQGLAYYGACRPTDGRLFRRFLSAIDGQQDLAKRSPCVIRGAVATFTLWYRALAPTTPFNAREAVSTCPKSEV